jgi:hypothetical protein
MPSREEGVLLNILIIHAYSIIYISNMTLSEYMLSTMQKILSSNREYFYKASEQADRIIVWLVGFSIASIALAISNSNNLKSFPVICLQ